MLAFCTFYRNNRWNNDRSLLQLYCIISEDDRRAMQTSKPSTPFPVTSYIVMKFNSPENSRDIKKKIKIKALQVQISTLD